ncbi:sulfurtransferase [Azospirillum picis]|uniref:Thiosulfate/3-mercaptopyruvate sulfurtransferase n=1 Tax=Azospirillum picis TaxID=488438 RepID=A0ABU0MLW2_9PROT|nr:sulfurtransferase [Azospirillum picis]MBP2300489.1 thiosulfate/3-mercaptopyruvate sulfurtransferase [Azospirillum picis]MDQ0534458.1 thiosulfate/3-mercaptopyruvate sulfurtransferase [Azospirillum picis]
MTETTLSPLVSADWLKHRLGGATLVVLDLRTPAAGGFIPGSVHSDYATAGWRATVGAGAGMLPDSPALETLIGGLGIGNGDHVVLVAAGANASDMGNATRVYWTFRMLGHDAVSVLDGGFAAWTAAAGPVKPLPSDRKPVAFKATPRSDLRATLPEVEAVVASGSAPLHDARSAEQFAGKAKSPQARAAGTIPGAVNLDIATLYSAPDHRFASAEAIRDLADKAGLPLKDQPITFCNTGHLASVSWFALSEIAGVPGVRLYDGSMSEWSADPARPLQNGG